MDQTKGQGINRSNKCQGMTRELIDHTEGQGINHVLCSPNSMQIVNPQQFCLARSMTFLHRCSESLTNSCFTSQKNVTVPLKKFKKR